ncbi:MAG: isoleucine--tRNA ligase [Candidatus Buchananbacteria bacterium]|jgi:isoleucyl-tRNA synthetase
MTETKLNSIVENEHEVQEFWKTNKIFEQSLEQTKNGPAYSFYDGPPFATGTPHYGHLVGSAMKDVVPRYWTMKGYHVARRWGWDCHGLPIENIIEKQLGFKSKKDILKYGVDKFNEACRSKVLEYTEEWKITIGRFGRWADMDNPYKTMDLDYMETVWWVFKELYDKDLVYEGYKSMHVCPRCETTLSQQEVSEGYRDIKDLSATAKFELVDEPGTYVLAWTTTPWTLPANVALAVNPEKTYFKIKLDTEEPDKKDRLFILIKDNRLMALEPYGFKIIEEFSGQSLVGKKYRPLFPYYESAEAKAKLNNIDNLYTIVSADFVTTEDGTGVVHIAPAFGEDDMRLGKERNLPFIQNVTMSGNFTAEVTDFAGENVKPSEDTQKTDVMIIKYLAGKGLLFAKEKYEHSYPHCWRCDTPLINYATSSWFVKVTDVKDKAMKLAEDINWSPEHIKEGRFGKWLEGARDWSISRQRFWASVMPIWKCGCGEMKVYGSVAELEHDSGEKITDLHKHHIDKVTVKCHKCQGEMKRIPDVLDTWFDSGSMPYAQKHYPFENKKEFEHSFPAKFIAEGVDQTRAWFYYLHMIASAIKGSRAFDNVIVNGIVLAEDGKKMAKKLQNYPEPEVIMEKYGADALRYYLLSAPVMQAENMNFSEAGVKEAMQKVVMLLNNIISFYELYKTEDTSKPPLAPPFVKGEKNSQFDNVLDQWLLAKLDSLIAEVTKSMEAYDLPRSVRPIQEFIDEFSTWWLRRSRDRFKGEDEADKKQAIAAFRHAILELSKVMAPFTPFIAEQAYKRAGGELESVHLAKWPKVGKIGTDVLEQMEQVKKIVELGLASRAQNGIKIRQPLSKLEVYGMVMDEIYSKIIADEVNVKVVEFKKDLEIKSSEKPRSIHLEFNDTINLSGENIKDTIFSKNIRIVLYTELTEELKAEGVLRELVRTINGLRKDAGLTIQDRITIGWHSDGEIARKVFADPALSAELLKSVLADSVAEAENDEKPVNINGEKVKIKIVKV